MVIKFYAPRRCWRAVSDTADKITAAVGIIECIRVDNRENRINLGIFYWRVQEKNLYIFKIEYLKKKILAKSKKIFFFKKSEHDNKWQIYFF